MVAQIPALRCEIVEAIRCVLVREGSVRGPTRQVDRLVPSGLGRAGLADPASYAPGDTVLFRRPCKRLSVRQGDERTVAAVDPEASVVRLAGGCGRTRHWKPGSLAALAGGVELFRNERLELRAGDRVRWTQGDPASGLSSGHVERIASRTVRVRLEDGTVAEIDNSDARLRYVERAWSSPPGAPRARTATNFIAAVGTGDPRLAVQGSLFAVVSGVPERAQLVTDDAGRLAHLLEVATGERVGPLDALARSRSCA